MRQRDVARYPVGVLRTRLVSVHVAGELASRLAVVSDGGKGMGTARAQLLSTR
jgi:hypothetical protein